ncbi:hypothetical protein ACLKA6_018637 [Drosophila palustris]
MKLTLFALLAAFCVLSANAGTLQYEADDFADVVVDGEFMEPELFGFWGIIKTALRGVKGFNCMLKWVVGIKDSALQYNNDIVACGVEANKDVTNLINANLKIIQTANNIIHLKTTICASTEDDTKPSITNNCTLKTFAQIISLYRQVKRAIALSKKIPKTGPNAIACVCDATNTLTSYYTQFPANIKSCSQLTSN